MLDGKTLGFIGGGNMAEALIAGVLRSGDITAQSVLVAEPVAERADYLRERYGVQTLSTAELAARAAIIVVAVKPQIVDSVTTEIQGTIDPGALIISVAAGVPAARFEAALPNIAVVRVMPNTPALVGEGMSVIAPGAAASPQHLQHARTILSGAGKVVQLEESQLDAVTAVSGSGPAYFFYLVEALIDGAQALGLDKATATELVVQTAYGAATMLRDSGRDAHTLRTDVTSPGGTTAAGLQVLEDNGARDLFAAMITAARDRSVALGNNG
ncbi:MAG: pyrroline-5-carboxylate reductase [Cumulibacter sp.]